MKKRLIIMAGILCLMANMFALPRLLGGLLIKKGTYSYYPELTQLWQSVKPEMSRLVLFCNPTQEYKVDVIKFQL